MENSKQQLIERLQSANNILVTVSANPSVDQLSAAIGLTLMLNKMGKHGTAVFSGKVPSTIEFLQPEKTIEKNTDSLRDFIIALDKTKADKLRYKVEDSHVKIFITPYRTSITDKDLEFSQGDFNVEVVIALGVKEQKDLDKAITAHGRILHDATTISITNGAPSTLGSIDWDQADMSSLCEMVASLAADLQADLLDSQIATALMTGIVAETERFRNAKTMPSTMNISASLMGAGANQQLIATKLEETKKPVPEAPKQPEPVTPPTSSEAPAPKPSDDAGALQIQHEEPVAKPPLPAPEEEIPANEVHIDEHGNFSEKKKKGKTIQPASAVEGGGSLILDPPLLGGTLTANAEPEHLDPSVDPLSVDNTPSTLLERGSKPAQQTPAEETKVQDAPQEIPSDLPIPEPEVVPEMPADLGIAPVENPQVDPEGEGHEQTLAELETAVQNSYDEPVPPTVALPQIPEPTNITPDDITTPDVGNARDAVYDALASLNQPLPPIESLNAQPFDINAQLGAAHDATQLPEVPNMPSQDLPPLPPQLDEPQPMIEDPNAPPMVPPPFMPGMPGLGPLPPVPPQSNAPTASNPSNPFNLPPA